MSHTSFFCSKEWGSIPTCPRPSGLSLPNLTRRSANPSRWSPHQLCHSLHSCTLSPDVSSTKPFHPKVQPAAGQDAVLARAIHSLLSAWKLPAQQRHRLQGPKSSFSRSASVLGEIYPVNPSSSVFFLWRWFSNVLLLQKLKRRLPHHHCFLVQQINRQRKQAPRLICRPPLIGSSGKLLYNHLPPSSPRSMETKRNYIVCVSVCHSMTHGSPR